MSSIDTYQAEAVESALLGGVGVYERRHSRHWEYVGNFDELRASFKVDVYNGFGTVRLLGVNECLARRVSGARCNLYEMRVSCDGFEVFEFAWVSVVAVRARWVPAGCGEFTKHLDVEFQFSSYTRRM